MIQMEVEFSRIDNKPTDISKAHILIHWLMPEVAKSLTYTILVPKEPDG